MSFHNVLFGAGGVNPKKGRECRFTKNLTTNCRRNPMLSEGSYVYDSLQYLCKTDPSNSSAVTKATFNGKKYTIE